MEEKSPVIFIYCDSMYTKNFISEMPGEFFKGHYIRRNFRQAFSRGVGEGTGEVPSRFSYIPI